MYLYELVNWLTTVVDSLVIKETYKEEAYKGALGYIVECLMVSGQKQPFIYLLIHFFVQDFLTGRDIPMMNEHAISNILIDVDFLEDELRRIGRSHLATAFTELRLVSYNDLENSDGH
jgi:exocyst complex component 6